MSQPSIPEQSLQEDSQQPQQHNGSFQARLIKYSLHYILPLPALLLLMAIVIPPLFTGFVVPFMKFRLPFIFENSTWIGLDNLRHLFGDPSFRQALVNTLTIKLSGTLLGGLLALGLALALHALHARLLRRVLVTLFLVPFVIPSAVMAQTVMDLFSLGMPSSSDGFTMDIAAWIKPLIIALTIVKTCGIPVALALAAIAVSAAGPEAGYARAVVVPAVRAIAAFMLVQLTGLFTADFDLVYSMMNPIVMEQVITLDIYIVQTGFRMGLYNLAGSAWFVQFLLQLPLLIVAYFLIRRHLSPSLFAAGPPSHSAGPVGGAWRIVGAIVVAPCALLIGFLLYRQFVYPFLQTSEHVAGLGERLMDMPYFAYLLLIFFAVIFHSLFTVMLAYPLTVRTLPGRGAYKALLLLIVAAGPMLLQQFFHFRPLINTLWPYFLLGLFNLMGVFVLKERFNQQFGEQKRLAEQSGRGEFHTLLTLFLPNIWRPLIGLGVLQAIAWWNAFLIPFLYNSNPAYYSPITAFHALAFGSMSSGIHFGDPLILRIGALVSLPPLLLFLAFHRWVTADLFLSQIRRY